MVQRLAPLPCSLSSSETTLFLLLSADFLSPPPKCKVFFVPQTLSLAYLHPRDHRLPCLFAPPVPRIVDNLLSFSFPNFFFFSMPFSLATKNVNGFSNQSFSTVSLFSPSLFLEDTVPPPPFRTGIAFNFPLPPSASKSQGLTLHFTFV